MVQSKAVLAELVILVINTTALVSPGVGTFCHFPLLVCDGKAEHLNTRQRVCTTHYTHVLKPWWGFQRSVYQAVVKAPSANS